MPALRATALGLAVLTLAACGSNATKQRHDAVNSYLDDVRRAQIELAGQVGRIDAALAAFSLRNVTPRELRELRRGRTTVQRALGGVRALDAPPDAHTLDGLILERLTLQRDLLDELIVTAADERRLATSVPKLQAASAKLRSDFAAVGSSTVPSQSSGDVLQRYGTAFAAYGDALRPIVPGVVPSRRPSLLTPLIRSEHDGLVRSIALTATIRSALRTHDIAAANRAVHSLLTIAATLNGFRTQQAEAAVSRAYNAKIRRIGTLGTAISREHARLVKLVG